MTPPDLQKLLGGYAAGTLTPEERRALFDAALADQKLFDALADEEALREVLADPACRERVQAALVERPPTAFWLRRPAVWGLAAATAAAAVVLTVAVLRTTSPAPRTASAPQQIAMANKPARPDLVPSTPTPSPAPATRTPRPRAHGGAAESETRVAEFSAPPSLSAQRRQLAARAPAFAAKPSAPPPPTAADAVTPESSSARAAQLAQAAPAAPPPPPRAVTQTVTVEAASPLIQTEGPPADQDLESKQISNLPIAGRDAAELMKVMPGMAAAGKQGPFGFFYTLLRRGEGGEEVEVPPGTLFRRRESLHVRIEPAQGGYLYVLAGKRALFAGPVVASQPVLIVTRPGVLDAVLLPQPDAGPSSTLVSRARQQQMEAARFQRSDGTHLGVPAEPAPILAEISIKSR